MILCFDIGGSWIKSAVAHSADQIAILDRYPTPLDEFAAFVEILNSVLSAQPARPDRIDQRPLQADLETLLGLPVLIANDADCFVLAEAGKGAARGHRIVLGIILGSGVGGGLVVDGRLVNADGGFAGEWGHGPAIAAHAGDPPVAIPAYACTCGQRGCVNTVGGARGLERLHMHLHTEEIASTEIVAAWQSGDPKAARSIQVYVDLISSPLALAINITGASIVPAGGGLANSKILLSEIDQTVRRRILRRFDRPLVVKAECEGDPGLIGAALMGLEQGGHG